MEDAERMKQRKALHEGLEKIFTAALSKLSRPEIYMTLAGLLESGEQCPAWMTLMKEGEVCHYGSNCFVKVKIGQDENPYPFPIRPEENN